MYQEEFERFLFKDRVPQSAAPAGEVWQDVITSNESLSQALLSDLVSEYNATAEDAVVLPPFQIQDHSAQTYRTYQSSKSLDIPECSYVQETMFCAHDHFSPSTTDSSGHNEDASAVCPTFSDSDSPSLEPIKLRTVTAALKHEAAGYGCGHGKRKSEGEEGNDQESRRVLRNREAQRAFRERQKALMEGLKAENKQLQQAKQQLLEEHASRLAELERLRSRDSFALGYACEEANQIIYHQTYHRMIQFLQTHDVYSMEPELLREVLDLLSDACVNLYFRKKVALPQLLRVDGNLRDLRYLRCLGIHPGNHDFSTADFKLEKIVRSMECTPEQLQAVKQYRDELISNLHTIHVERSMLRRTAQQEFGNKIVKNLMVNSTPSLSDITEALSVLPVLDAFGASLKKELNQILTCLDRIRSTFSPHQIAVIFLTVAPGHLDVPGWIDALWNVASSANQQSNQVVSRP